MCERWVPYRLEFDSNFAIETARDMGRWEGALTGIPSDAVGMLCEHDCMLGALCLSLRRAVESD